MSLAPFLFVMLALLFTAVRSCDTGRACKAMKTETLLGLLERIAPERLSESWDNVGLLVGTRRGEINKILICLDIDENVVQAAANSGVDVIVSHHPVLFKAVKRISLDEPSGRILGALLKNEITAIALHTNLDVAHGGVNDVLAGLFDLKCSEVLEPVVAASCPDDTACGMGRVGTLKTPVTVREFVDTVKQALGVDHVRVVGPMDGEVKRVAFMGGSGGRAYRHARNKDFQVLVTGDVSYHVALEAASDGVVVIDAGHRATERVVLKPLADLLDSRLKEAGLHCDVEFYYPEKDIFTVM